MLSTLNRQQNDPHDVVEIAPEVVLASREDTQESPTLAPGATSRPADPPLDMGSDSSIGIAAPSVDTTFRATAVDDILVEGKRAAIGKWAARAFVGLLLAGGSTAAAVAWQAYGNSAKEVIATLTPQLGLAPSTSTETPADQASEPAAQVAATDQAAPQPAAVDATDGTAPAAVAASPEQGQSLQSMARDLAAMGQQVEQLKASIEQLRAGQEQMSREITKASETRASEQSARPKLSALPPRAPAAPVRKPKPPMAHAQAAAASPMPPRTQAVLPPLPQATAPVAAPLPAELPPQATAQPDGEPVLRPPMPVR
jgi:hypothetical protein